MPERLSTLLLGPLLLLQGIYTRRVTPRLPEASGARQGQAGNGARLRLLIVGDSAVAGVGAATQDQALSGQLVARLAEDFQVSWQLWAQTGLDSQDLLELLEGKDAQPFDVAVLGIGVNDVTSRLGVDQWLARQQRLLGLLRGKFAVQQLVISPLPPMHLFPALPQPLRWYLGNRARRFNQQLATLTAAQPSCTLLTLSLTPEAGLMAADGFHPGPVIYSLWAEHAAQAITGRQHNNNNPGVEHV
ncbi:SGNH/GDSL hydrolase family protein [Pseudomonas sp. RA_35y_Pfl2_P32]|uniref:SGNH/GDSL hydrolase family protein n=1 Tax=Pseudomonas sp. RA_35y_Pfl2_P32 TaxID=3088705 RepID=UPI0030D7C427